MSPKIAVALIISSGLIAFGLLFLAKENVPQEVMLVPGTPVKASVASTAPETFRIVIGGDVMLDRHNRTLGQEYGYESLFTGIATLFKSADLGIANLEGTVTTYPSVTLLPDGTYGKQLIFTFATTTPFAIKNAGISLVSLANNHSYNFGADGLSQTHTYLSDAGVKWFGSPLNTSGTEDIECKGTLCVAFVGYHEFNPGIETMLADVKRLSSAGYPVVVMAHWGDEYATVTPARLHDEAEEFVAAGATVIVGAHPHVIGSKEWIGNVPVIYSLGNLVFDQYFSPDVMTGNVAEIDFVKDESGTHIAHVYLYTVSDTSHTGPVVAGGPIEFLPKGD